MTSPWDNITKHQLDLAALVENTTKHLQEMAASTQSIGAMVKSIQESQTNLQQFVDNVRQQNEKLLQRAAELISATWNGPNVFVRGVAWEKVALRWISDYERRDEWVNTDDDQQG